MIIRVCGVGAYEARLEKQVDLDLTMVARILEEEHKIVVRTPYIVIANVNDVEVSIFTDGKLIIKKVENKNQAEKIAENVYGCIGIEIMDK